ncbi:MAG: uracil-DNA glycosylase [Verrucomicrobiaceae bacterium]|nr:MAG: uracil-DNA glycosylase [Verrucomicrobiaceae bacterium]
MGVSRPVDAVIEFLEAEKARGVTHILLDDAAREGLRALYRRGRTAKQEQRAPAAAAVVPQAAAPAAPVVVSSMLTVTGSTKAERLASLQAQAANWPPARALGTLRETMVFSTGNPDARIMLVGEAPGYEEEKKREPFVGPAGQKLTDILKAMGLAREEVYISNIVKFRPATPRQTTNNRPPGPEEIAACLPFIRAEVEIVRPECIIALGGTAAQGLLGSEATVGSLRGAWHELGGIPLRVTYHPSYLLRSNADHATKRQVWEDMLAVMERLEMPISENQRAFFLPK